MTTWRAVPRNGDDNLATGIWEKKLFVRSVLIIYFHEDNFCKTSSQLVEAMGRIFVHCPKSLKAVTDLNSQENFWTGKLGDTN